MIIFEICDGICYSFILAYFAAHDDKDIFWLTETLLDFFLLWTTGTGIWPYEALKGEEYGHSVQMLAWNAKFQAQRVKVSCPAFHSISAWAHCSTQKSKCWPKVLVCFMMTALQLTVMFTQKTEPCVFKHQLRLYKMDFEESALPSIWHKSLWWYL